MKNLVLGFLILATPMGLTGCEAIHKVKVMLGLAPRTKLPAEINHEMNSVINSEEVTAAKTAGELAKENSELLYEMMTVIFDQKKIDDKSNFGELAHSLDVGASLEGIYRGLVMGSRYRSLETRSQAADPDVLKAFALEMAEIQGDMKNPSEFIKGEAKKAPSIEYPTGASDETAANIPAAAPNSQEVKTKKSKKEILDEMLENFIGASQYTLKRVLGEEALKKLDESKDSSGDLAQWYAHMVLRMCDKGVDFGLAQRNDPNFDFHFKFAQTMSLDRVKWEVLNRYHRYLNFMGHKENR